LIDRTGVFFLVNRNLDKRLDWVSFRNFVTEFPENILIMNRIIIFLLAVLLLPFIGKAQVHTPLFPNLAEDDLLNAIQSNYLPNNVLSYGMARDTMFSRIYNINDSLTCVYTGHRIYLDPSQDPTQAAFMDGANNGINTEHTYPRSKGAENGNARSDMHHLFATRTPVNSARASFPFADIDDNITNTWFRNNQSQSAIPSSDIIDEFSESRNGSFEPREDFKGNIARAVFYFYTMYRNQANSADPNFFEIQRATLLRWHQEDPVDQKEYDRTFQIAEYQSDKPNPFILDTLLAYRIYCMDNIGVCEVTVPTTTIDLPEFSLGQNLPNPTTGITRIPYTLGTSATVQLRVYDLLGNLVETLVNNTMQTAGDYEVNLELDQTGVYFYELLVRTDHGNQHFGRRFVVGR